MTTKRLVSKRWAIVATVGLTMIAANAPAVADQPAATQAATAPIDSASNSTSTNVQTTPPPRPLPLTIEQADALEQLAMQPEYQIDPNIRAAFSPETQKKITETSAPGFYAGFFSALMWLLIAAAPL